MIDPKNIREFSILMTEYRKGVEDRIGLLQKMVWSVIGLLGAILVGAAAIYVQLGDIKTDIAIAKTSLGTIGERLARIEKAVDDIRNAERQVLATLGRLETRQQPDQSGTIAGLSVTDSEAQLIRQWIKTPSRTSATPKISIGDELPNDVLKPLPEDLVAKISKLKGVRYTIDETNAIALVDPASHRVFAVI